MELYKYPIQEPTAEQSAMEIYEFILPKIEHYAEWKAVTRILGLQEKFADLSQVPEEFQEEISDQEPKKEVAKGLKLLLLACKEGKFPQDTTIFTVLGKFPYLTYETLLLICDLVAEGKKNIFFEKVKNYVKNPVLPQIWAGGFNGATYLTTLAKHLEESVRVLSISHLTSVEEETTSEEES